MTGPKDYSILFDELKRLEQSEEKITLKFVEQESPEMDNIRELQEIVAECSEPVEPLFTTT